MLRRLGIGRILVGGGLFAAAALIVLGFAQDWTVYAVAMLLMGLGFYMMHNTFQAQVTEVAPHARASAVALHAFSFFCGQALGVVIMGLGQRTIGLTPSTGVAALVILGVGVTAAMVLTRPAPQPRGR
jgi:predicted MFS family arabinose efflux permease